MGSYPLKERFRELFQGLDRAHSVWVPDGQVRERDNKIQGRYKIVSASVTEDTWDLHLRGRQGLGIVPVTDGGECHFGCIDIDDYNLDMGELETGVAKYELPLVLSMSKSGGAHLWLFMTEAASAKLVRNRLQEWSIALGRPSAEIFPKQNRLSSDKDIGNPINMPYFGETRGGVLEGVKLSPRQFIESALEKRVTEQVLTEINIDYGDSGLMEGGPPCLQAIAQVGIPRGQRNNTLFNVAVYLRLRYDEGWEENFDKYNQAMATPPLGHKEMAALVKAVNKKDYFYTCDQAPLVGLCNKSLCRDRTYGVGGTAEPPMLPDGLQKLMYDPPRWIMLVEGQNVETDTKTLMNQTSYLQLVVEKCDRYPPPAKPQIWRKHIDTLLKQCDVIEVPGDASDFGHFQFLVEEFLSGRRDARTKEEVAIGKVWKEEGNSYFRSADLIKWVEQNGMRVRGRQMWSWLRNMGAGHRTMNMSGKTYQCWYVKTPESNMMEEDNEVPF